MLERVNNTEDLKKLTIKEKEELAEDIRKYIIEVTSKNGGHIASNLGVVELTLALESVFDVNKDKIIWDVGHQSYVHKILNGRKEELKNIRKLGGIAGFPKTKESETDCFKRRKSFSNCSNWRWSINRWDGIRSIKSYRMYKNKCNSCIKWQWNEYI